MTLQIVNHYSKQQHQQHILSDNKTTSLHWQTIQTNGLQSSEKRHLLLAEEFVIEHNTNMKGGFIATLWFLFTVKSFTEKKETSLQNTCKIAYNPPSVRLYYSM